MARKTTTIRTDKTDLNSLKHGTCKNLLGTATIGYELGIDDTSALWWRLTSNTGNGYFSRDWVRFEDIQKALSDWPEDPSINSMTLRPLLLGKSINSQARLNAIARELNERPRKTLDFETPAARFNACVAATG